jgi:hypothetical protein
LKKNQGQCTTTGDKSGNYQFMQIAKDIHDIPKRELAVLGLKEN